jgi:hypothetical protein
MVTLLDVLHKIGIDKFRSSDKFSALELNVCITNDVEESEADFMNKYGAGNTYYYRLENYHHGRKLAAALYQRIKGYILDFPDHIFSKNSLNKTLYFFVHIKDHKENPALLVS